MKIKERGYYELKWGDQSKWMHLASRTFIGQIQEVTGVDMVTFGKELAATDKKSEQEQFDKITDLVHAGFRAYDLEEDIEIGYNSYKVGNWLHDACNDSDLVIQDIFDTLNAALPKQKGVKGKKKS